MNGPLYQAPRWWRETFFAWARDQGLDKFAATTTANDLFTRLVNARPPEFKVVTKGKEPS